jgi:hypothetical protein
VMHTIRRGYVLARLGTTVAVTGMPGSMEGGLMK